MAGLAFAFASRLMLLVRQYFLIGLPKITVEQRFSRGFGDALPEQGTRLLTTVCPGGHYFVSANGKGNDLTGAATLPTLLHGMIIMLAAVALLACGGLVFYSLKSNRILLYSTVPITLGTSLWMVKFVFLALDGSPSHYTHQLEVVMNLGRAFLWFGILVCFFLLKTNRIKSDRKTNLK